MSTFTHALYITVVGMGLVFLALGLLLIVMVALGRLFPSRPEHSAVRSPATGAPAVSVQGVNPETVAAISIALAHALTGAQDGYRYVAAPPATSGWASAGRYRQLHQPRTREKRS